MANRSSDFNYKVALASGLKSLQGKRLRQAEEQFRYLVQHFPTAEGGYRGLAKVRVEQADRAAALKTLLDGGAALAKAGQRDGAINVLKEAVQLDPRDRTAHRRLASSLALAGDTEAAAHEYVRFIRDVGDPVAARMEAEYALERMPHHAEIEEAARAAGATVVAHAEPAHAEPEHAEPEHAEPKHAEPAHAEPTHMTSVDREDLVRSAFGPVEAEPAAPTHEPWAPPVLEPAPSDAQNDAWKAEGDAAWAPPREAWQSAPSGADPWAAEPAPEAPSDSSNGEIISADVDDTTVEATAARYLATRDPRGGTAALEAARRYIVAGHMDAASDLLLQLIAAGIADHEAQRLLLEVTRNLGKKDVTKAKVQLLVEALKLDGHAELAAEVEQQAQEA
ncbi:MAG TPA: hypothetical protein VEU77_01240 [Candidatus Acidoferrales bacterium]|nr:hypothetical protein [Candidatus Acidoferrales bacterium]